MEFFFSSFKQPILLKLNVRERFPSLLRILYAYQNCECLTYGAVIILFKQ